MVLNQPARLPLIGIVFISAVLSGCAFGINAQLPIQPPPPGRRIPVKAAVIIPPAEAEREQPVSGMFWVGMANTWVLELGEALTKYSQHYFPAVFESSTLFSKVDSKAIDKNYAVLVEPKLQDVLINQSFHTTLTLSCTVKDRNGNLLYNRSFKGETQRSGAFTKACFCGVFRGESAMEDTFSDALDHAFRQLIDDMRTDLKR